MRIASTWATMSSRASAVMTGPTSTERRAGSPISSSAMAPLSIVSMRSATSSCRQRMRSAEQRWPAESKAEETTSPTTCSASAEESTTSAFSPPVSAINGSGLPGAGQAAGQLPLDEFGDRRRAGEDDALNAADRRPERRRPRRRRARDASALAGTPAACRRRTASRGDQRRLLGRLRQHGIAGGERRRDLAGEDRERKIPRTDAHDGAERRCAPSPLSVRTASPA